MLTPKEIGTLIERFSAVFATKQELEKIREEMATKDELRKVMTALDRVLHEVLAIRTAKLNPITALRYE